jgi:hypothetical protein
LRRNIFCHENFAFVDARKAQKTDYNRQFLSLSPVIMALYDRF